MSMEIEKRYLIDRKRLISQGGTAKVYAGKDPITGEVVAFKVPSGYYELEEEADLHSSLSHPNILRCMGTQPVADRTAIILEYAPISHIDLVLKSNGLSLDILHYFLVKMISALEYLHSVGVAHCDIKPDNILWAGKVLEPKLSDFGLSQRYSVDGPIMAGYRGTDGFRAPEVEAKIDTFDPMAADIWSLGATMMASAVAANPCEEKAESKDRAYGFLCADQPEARRLYFQVYEGKRKVPHDLQNLIMGMMAYDPKQRWTMEKIKTSAFYLNRGASEKKTQAELDKVWELMK